MKTYIILALALIFPVLGHAQTTDLHSLSYSVHYEKAHLFLQKDGGFNVVDYDIEWPEVIDFDSALALRQTISKTFTSIATNSLDSLLSGFNAVFGQPVTGPFKTIPDDNKFCYITSTAKILGYDNGHWIAYYIDEKVEPQKASAFKARHDTRVVVYDISRGKLFTATDLITSAVTNRTEPQDFYDFLFYPLSDDIYNDMQACRIEGVWTSNNLLCFLVNAKTSEQEVTYTASMPLEQYYYALSREGKRLFTREAKRREPQTIMAAQTWRGDTIYNNVEKMPQFKGGTAGLKEYLSHVTSPNVMLSRNARVFVSFIVDKEGKVQDISVINPVNPEIDRHAASVFRGMPPFTPGEQDGKKVCVRMYMPITYK